MVTRGVVHRGLAGLAAVAVWLAVPAAAQAQKVFGDRIECTPNAGVRFCPGSVSTRVRTFDNIPLDVNVTLPGESGTGPYPLVIQLHGYGGAKSGLSASQPFAERGYAVLNYTARGFGQSCGAATSRNTPACARGWIHLADSRFEVRDSQHLAGLLVDEGFVEPQKIAATGGSYGGGQSLQLAALGDRMRMPDGSYAPFVSPTKKIPMRIAATAPVIPWSDLVYSLLPNGRTLDYTVTRGEAPPAGLATGDDLAPVGVKKETFVDGLYASGQASGFYAPPGVDSDADLTRYFTRVNAGEPYTDPVVADAVDELARHHSGFYIDRSQAPAPTFISNGFTDDLFPVDEALRFTNRTLQEHPDAKIGQLHFDHGHQRGQTKSADTALLQDRILSWFDHYVRGVGPEPPGGVEVLTQTCPKTAPSEGPFSAPTYGQIHPGEVRLVEPAARVVSSEVDGVDKRVLDPIVAGNNPCGRTSAADQPQPGVATYRLPAVTGNGYTLAGAPTVIADVAVTSATPRETQLATRLWDVAPDGQQTLVARGLYRPEGSGRQVFQLHPNAYRFATGHVAKLEVLGQDTPYARKSTGPAATFTATLSNLELRLPTLESRSCAADAQVVAPAEPFVSTGSMVASQALVPAAVPCGAPPTPPLPGAAAPACSDVSVLVARGGSATVPLRCSDPDAGTTLTYSIESPPAGGTATLNPDGTATYRADPEFSGQDQFTYRASDGALSSNVATVRITVPASASGPAGSTTPSPGDPSPGESTTGPRVRCLPALSKVRARGIGPVRVGDSRSQVRRRAGREAAAGSSSLFYCVRGGGLVTAVTHRGSVRLVTSTARNHRSRSIRSGSRARAVRRAYRTARFIGDDVLLVRRAGKGLIFGTRRGRVSFVGVTSAKLARRPALILRDLRRSAAI